MSEMKRVGYGYVSRTEQEIIEKLSREEKHMNAIIYTKPQCQKCRRTVFKLSRVMPVQTITADGTHDEWCDLQVDKIKQYTED